MAVSSASSERGDDLLGWGPYSNCSNFGPADFVEKPHEYRKRKVHVIFQDIDLERFELPFGRFDLSHPTFFLTSLAGR